MWPFSKRGLRFDLNHGDNRFLVALPADFSVFSRNDACIKLWLPERLVIALDQLSAATEMSRPDVLRWLSFEHVYGRVALDKLTQWKKEQDEIERQRKQAHSDSQDLRLSPTRRTLVSVRAINLRVLGKSAEDFKLWLPAAIKVELERLAKTDGHGLSDYLRKVLILLLLGELFYRQWSQAISQVTNTVKPFKPGDCSRD